MPPAEAEVTGRAEEEKPAVPAAAIGLGEVLHFHLLRRAEAFHDQFVADAREIEAHRQQPDFLRLLAGDGEVDRLSIAERSAGSVMMSTASRFSCVFLTMSRPLEGR